MQLRQDDIHIFDALERSVRVIALIARMLLGLGLAIALFLQVYMAILTDLRCEAENPSLGNLIRCTTAMEMISGAIILLAGIGIAASFFSNRRLDFTETLIMLLVAVAINFISALTMDTASWQVAMVLAALFAALAGVVVLRQYFGDGRADAPAEPSRPDR